jgi:putative transposase
MVYRGHRFPVEIINHCVWLYYRFRLSLRDIKERMAQRGVIVSYQTIHQ